MKPKQPDNDEVAKPYTVADYLADYGTNYLVGNDGLYGGDAEDNADTHHHSGLSDSDSGCKGRVDRPKRGPRD